MYYSAHSTTATRNKRQTYDAPYEVAFQLKDSIFDQNEDEILPGDFPTLPTYIHTLRIIQNIYRLFDLHVYSFFTKQIWQKPERRKQDEHILDV